MFAVEDVGGVLVPTAGAGLLFMLAALLIKTMWPQIGGWQAVLASTQQSEQAALVRAEEAMKDASEARAAAVEAQKQAGLAWQEVQACERRSAELERKLHERSAERDNQIRLLQNEVATLREQMAHMLGNNEGA